MARPTTTESLIAENEKARNVAEKNYAQRTATASRLQEAEGSLIDNNKSAGISEAESIGTPAQNSLKDGFFNPGDGGSFDNSGNVWQTIGLFFRKKGATFGVVGILLGGGIFGAGVAGPGTMLVNLTENISGHNDSVSPSMNNRLRGVLNNMMGKDGLCKVRNASCRMGKISNRGLNRLAKAGIIANNHTGKRLGYPDRNPTSFKINGVDKPIDARNLNQFLYENKSIARKVLGVNGAFRLRFNMWAGNQIVKVFKKFGVIRNGGLADGNNSGSADESSSERAHRKKNSSINEPDTTNGAKDISSRTKGKITKGAKVGGTAYAVMLAACMLSKVPSIVSGAVAGYQLLQILPLISDTVLSPGSKLMAGEATPEDIEVVGTLLTERVENSAGVMGSALDSKYLLAAMGVNSSPTGPSSEFTPGYAILTSDAMKALKTAEDAMEGPCNIIMNPITMYTVMGIGITIKAITGGATAGVGALALQGVDTVTGMVASEGVSLAVEKAAPVALEMFAKNKNLVNARGIAFGDALGISAMAYFSTGNMSSGLGVLSMKQLPEFARIKNDEEQLQREMDIAALSPLDTSSKYTFLGSIAHNITTSMVQFGAYNQNIGSFFSTILRLPSLALPTANAASNSLKSYCGYASAFNLATDDPATTPAINAAGLPCSGISAEQSNMSTSEAIAILVNEGWIDESVETAENATVEDLVSSGYIVGDTPMSTFVQDCGDSSTGDYLSNAAGCILSTGNIDQVPGDFCYSGTNAEGEAENTCLTNSSVEGGANDYVPAKSTKAIEAISVFLLDYQIAQAINGENDFEPDSSSSGSANINLADIYNDSSEIPCDPRTTDNGVQDGYRKNNKVPIRVCGVTQLGGTKVNSRVSEAITTMVEDMNAAGISVSATSGFRTYSEQQKLVELAAKGGNQAAPAGTSNHQMGLAVDFRFYDDNGAGISNSQSTCKTVGGVCTPPRNSAGYTWMVANASKYGFTQLNSEFWHWEVVGGT